MKIAIIGTFLGQKTSGAEISALHLAKNLKNKHNSFIITTKITKNMPCKAYSIPITNIIPNIILLIGHPIVDKLFETEISRILKKEKPDIVHIQDPAMLVSSINAAKKLNIPSITTVRDYRFVSNLTFCLSGKKINFNYTKKDYKKGLKQALKESYNLPFLTNILMPYFFNQNNRLRSYFKKLDHYITVSNFVKDQLVKEGIKKDKITTIKVQKEDWKPKERSSKQITIFTAGGLKKTKGFDFLIRSIKRVAKKIPDVKLRIAGDGSDRNYLENLINKLKLKKNIALLGNISHEKIKNEYKNALFSISPSLWPEPLTRIIFESFSMKRTMIATDVGGTSELVKNMKTGLLVKPNNEKHLADTIIKLIKNPKLRKTLENNAYLLINKECNNKINYEKHIKIYAKLKNEKT